MAFEQMEQTMQSYWAKEINYFHRTTLAAGGRTE